MLLSRELLRANVHIQHIEETDTDRNDALAELSIAKLHLKSSEAISEMDSVGSYQLAYDGARKAIQALLMSYGLRVTSAGGHYAFVKIAESGISESPCWFQFRTMRQLRNALEYPDGVHHSVPSELLCEAHSAAHGIIRDVENLLNR
jgi:hypothetical protein